MPPDAAQGPARAHNDQAAEVRRDDGAAADCQSNDLRGFGWALRQQLHTTQCGAARGKRTAIQANFSDISPEATGRKGLLILSMLMS